MLKEGRWTLAFSAGTFVLTVVYTWMAVMHENEHHEGIAAMVITILAGVSLLAMNGYSVYRNLRDAHRCEKLHVDLKSQRKETQFVGGEAALLSFFEARADDLVRRLEELWHHWNAAGETLIHPIGEGKVEWKNWNIDKSPALMDERRDFMVLYGHHLHWLSLELPKFKSTTTINGYPSDKEYHEVLTNLKAHYEALGKLADEVWQSGKNAAM